MSTPAPPTRRERSWPRRLVIGSAALLLLLIATSGLWLPPWVVGSPSASPERWSEVLSPEAKALVDTALEGLEGVYDHHVHLVGSGHEGSGAIIHPDLTSWLHPIQHMKTAIYTEAGQVSDLALADSEYVTRLRALVEHHPADLHVGLLAFEALHDERGQPDMDNTSFHIPNDWTFKVAEKAGPRFDPVASIHPYRADATEALRRWHRAGGHMVKWLPNSMGIDPASPRCDAFYDTMAELGISLLTHAGDEHAVDGDTRQDLGNPLRLRRPLDRGVTVIIAHCAGLGMGADLDAPGGPPVSNFDLFLRLMGEATYEGRLYGEISAVVLSNRHGAPLAMLLEREDLHPRLLYGSDYPLVAIDWLIRTGDLASMGYISEEEAGLLDEVFGVNPLLFDLVLKRTLRAPGSQRGFDPSIFGRRVGPATR